MDWYLGLVPSPRLAVEISCSNDIALIPAWGLPPNNGVYYRFTLRNSGFGVQLLNLNALIAFNLLHSIYGDPKMEGFPFQHPLLQ
jgi:hypothetical protein